MSADLPKHLVTLLGPAAYPHPVTQVELIETHVAWVLLTGEYAYKIKRPVHYAFIDLRAAERRKFFCEEELRLNKRFASELYLDLCEIKSSNGEAHIGGSGEVIEHAVRMRQFSREDELDRLLAAEAIEPRELRAFGLELADIHAQLPAASAPQAFGRAASVRSLLLENLRECAQAAAPSEARATIEALHKPLTAWLEKLSSQMDARLAGGRIRECHGDLHAGNIVRRGSRLLAFDCLEFDPAFRWTDVADEIAFLLADLEARGCVQHGNAFLNGYLTQSGDYEACRMLPVYKCHRSLVRAKVASLSLAERSSGAARENLRSLFESYLRTASRALIQRRPLLVLMYGLSGSGKTWLASQLASHLNAVHVRSDVERKRLAGLAAQARSDSALASGLYSREQSISVYAHLARCTEHVLEGGYVAIIDATFGQRADRALFRDLGRRLGVELRVVRCHASQEVLRTRIASRQREGHDASEADLAVLDWQEAHAETISPDEDLTVIEVDTTLPQSVTRAAALLAP